ncbi:MAG: heavy-metal-associated domain-containing protein [Candidatus Peribacteraceae bacterium]|nr:heavy-metal-associated domain-containing protein [Candidatus Peribacteraceae bacterium]
MKTSFSIPGIHCNGCAQLITEVSGEQPGVINTRVHLDTKEVVVDHTDEFSAQTWKEQIEALDPKYKIANTL